MIVQMMSEGDAFLLHLRQLLAGDLNVDSGAILSRQDYERLITTAHEMGRERINLVMKTICATGIRVSEVRYITVETVRAGCATISLKSKIRTILLPGKLCRKRKRQIAGRIEEVGKVCQNIPETHRDSPGVSVSFRHRG